MAQIIPLVRISLERGHACEGAEMTVPVSLDGIHLGVQPRAERFGG